MFDVTARRHDMQAELEEELLVGAGVRPARSLSNMLGMTERFSDPLHRGKHPRSRHV